MQIRKLLMPLTVVSSLLTVWLVAAAFAEKGASFSESRGHTAYSHYIFSNDPRVIDFATPAIAIPSGVLTEIIKRDMVLRNALKKQGMELRFHPFQKGRDANYFITRGHCCPR